MGSSSAGRRGPGPRISLAYSVDADDAFMFHAIRTDRVDTRGFWFSHRRADTAALNRLAATGGADVVAISLAAYPKAAARYLLLPHGASVGRGFGPVVVAKRPMPPRELAGRRVGVPGLSTTAWLVLRLIEPAAVPVVIPIAPFSRVFEALDRDEIDAALLIHEGRLLFAARGLHEVVELGAWWARETGLPLPLGVNVIRRGLGDDLPGISSVLRDSLRWALDNRDQAIQELAGEGGEAGRADARLLDRYLAMYANEDTRAMAADTLAAMEALFERSRRAGILNRALKIELAP